MAEPLYALGRWDEAMEVIERALSLAAPPRTRACLQLVAGAIAVARGEIAAASASADSAARLLSGLEGRNHRHAEDLLAAARLRVDLLTAQGRRQDAVTAAHDAVRDYDVQVSPRYAWPLLAVAAQAAAEVAVAPAAARAEGSAGAAEELLAALATEAAKLEAQGPVQRANQLTYAAETLRAGRAWDEAAAAWDQAAAAWDQAGEPYPLAIAEFRAAEAVLAGGGSKDAAAERLDGPRGSLAGSAPSRSATRSRSSPAGPGSPRAAVPRRLSTRSRPASPPANSTCSGWSRPG